MSLPRGDDRNIISIAQALVRWINTFPEADSIASLEDLRNGVVLWRILQRVGPNYFTTDLPHPAAEDSETKWQNIDFIKRHVTDYLVEQCDQPDVVNKLNANSKSNSIQSGVEDDDMLQLLQLVLLAAVFSPEANEELVATMRSLGPSIANPIQRCIEQLTTSENFDDITVQKADDSRAGSSQRSLPIDSPSSTLLLEEQLIQARSATFNLQKHNDLLSAELEQAREQIKQLQQTITSDQSTTTRQADDVDTILANIRTEHADNIALLEEELYNAQTKITAQAKQLTQITALETSNAVLRTELDRLRHERDDLEQKHNATENLKKKLKSLQDEQTTSDLLRQNHEVAQAELDELRPLRDHNVQLKRKLQEVTQHLHSLEQTSHDDQRALEHAETELSYLNQSLIESREQHQRDQERLSEYQGRLRELELTQEDASFAASLEQELSTLESPLQSPTESSVVSPTRTVSGTQRGGGDDESGDSEIQTLRTRLATAEASLAAALEHNSSSKDNQQQLKDELDKMHSAWYDLTRRLQSDAVVMQRRSEAPRSWLGKMRRVVVASGSGGSGRVS